MNYQDNRKLWAERITKFHSSGMNQLQWCRENNISLSALRYWLRKSNPKSIVTVEAEDFEFASLDVPTAPTSNGITLELGAVKICLSDDFDETLLLKTIKTLQKL